MWPIVFSLALLLSAQGCDSPSLDAPAAGSVALDTATPEDTAQQPSKTGQLQAASKTGQLQAASKTGQLQAASKTGQLQAASETGQLQAASETGQLQAALECVVRDTTTRLRPVPGGGSIVDSAAWSDSVKRLVRAHRVCPGMSRTMLTAAWGLPEGYDEQRTGDYSTRQYRYPRHLVIVENDRVVAIRHREPASR